jgi:hypothetical protein
VPHVVIATFSLAPVSLFLSLLILKIKGRQFEVNFFQHERVIHQSFLSVNAALQVVSLLNTFLFKHPVTM